MNLTSLSTTQCYNITVIFDKEDVCSHFSTCKDAVLISQLFKVNNTDYVVLNSGKSTAEVVVSLPAQCRCTGINNDQSNSAGFSNGAIAGVVVAVVCATLVIASVIITVYCLYRKNRRKLANQSDFQ